LLITENAGGSQSNVQHPVPEVHKQEINGKISPRISLPSSVPNESEYESCSAKYSISSKN